MERTTYKQLGVEDRATIMLMAGQGHSMRSIAQTLGRAASSISREIRRNERVGSGYNAARAGERAQRLRSKPRRARKLVPGNALFAQVEPLLRECWSPEQIAGTLRAMWPNDAEQRVSHETIYNALYVIPRGSLRTELLACLRQGRSTRKPRARGTDRRGGIADMASIHLRPPQVEDRLVPGHWEGDLIKGAGNRSAVGTLVERTTRLVILAKMENATAAAGLAGFRAALNRVPESMRHTMTYDQGREMSSHAELTQATGVKIYFADPHSPWQRGSNENTNGLLRQFMPKGTDLSAYSQDQLDAIAHLLNTRPRKTLGFRTPIEVFAQHLALADQISTVQ